MLIKIRSLLLEIEGGTTLEVDDLEIASLADLDHYVTGGLITQIKIGGDSRPAQRPAPPRPVLVRPIPPVAGTQPVARDPETGRTYNQDGSVRKPKNSHWVRARSYYKPSIGKNVTIPAHWRRNPVHGKKREKRVARSLRPRRPGTRDLSPGDSRYDKRYDPNARMPGYKWTEECKIYRDDKSFYWRRAHWHKNPWAGIPVAQRSAEMRRRQIVAQKNRDIQS